MRLAATAEPREIRAQKIPNDDRHKIVDVSFCKCFNSSHPDSKNSCAIIPKKIRVINAPQREERDELPMIVEK